MTRLAQALVLLAALLGALPASADQILPPGRVTGSTGSGDILFGALKFGKRQAGKTILQPDSVEIQGSGSTGDVSAMSVAPALDAASGTLSKVIAGKGALDVLDTASVSPTISRRFQAGVTLDSGAYTRNSYASYTDVRGVLASVLPGAPRFVSDPVTGENRGLLIEGGTTNFLLNSAAPATQAVPLDPGTYTLSVVGAGSAALSGGASGAATQAAPVTFTLGSAATVTVTRTGALSRWQLEAGGFPTSFIATSATLKDVRALDAYSYPLPGNVWNTAEGTFMFDGFSAPYSAGAVQQAVEWGDGSAGNRLLIARDGSKNLSVALAIGGTAYPITLNTPWPDATRLRVAVAIGGGTMAVSVNGNPVVTAPAPRLPPATRMQVGDGADTNGTFYGSILSVHYIPRRTANAALPAMAVRAAQPSTELQALVAEKAPVVSPTFTGKTTAVGLFEATAETVPPRDSYTMHTLYSVNKGPQTASGVGQTYISSAINAGFDVAHQVTADFRAPGSTNTQSKLGQFMQVGSPPMQTGNVGAAVAEWNLTNRGAETGYQASISSPETYGGTVPYQQVGGLNLVPEANFSGAEGVGTNVTYGHMISRSSNKSKTLRDTSNQFDYPRTYTGYGTDRDSLVPAAKAIGGEGGRGFSFWGGVTAPLAPSYVGQTWGFWAHGIDLSRSTFAGNDPIRVKAGNEVVWETGNGTKVAGLAVTAGGALTLSSASGSVTTITGAPWTVYIPNYTPAGGSGVTITHNRASYEVVGKTLRMQVRFTLGLTSAPGYVDVTLPTGLALKDGSAGAAVNVSSGETGVAMGLPGASYIRIVGRAVTAAVNNSVINVSLVAELN